MDLTRIDGRRRSGPQFVTKTSYFAGGEARAPAGRLRNVILSGEFSTKSARFLFLLVLCTPHFLR